MIGGMGSVYLQIQIPGVGGKCKKLHFFFFSTLLLCYGLSVSPVDLIDINSRLVTW